MLIFDEVMTGFRLALGGASELYGMKADMMTLGKIVGGGLPWAAYGGGRRSWICSRRSVPVYQAGTLSGNPLAMAAGIATVGYLIEHRDGVYPLLERLSVAVADGIAAEAAKAGVAMTTNRVGAMWTWFFTGDSGDGFCDSGDVGYGGVRALSSGDAGAGGVAPGLAV